MIAIENSIPREKTYSIGTRIGYRAYYLLRRVFPKKKLLIFLLKINWLTQRLSYEQTYLYEKDRSVLDSEILRPNNIPDILLSAKPGDKVLDFGGGIGNITRALLKYGCRVTYVDHSLPAQLQAESMFSEFNNFSIADPNNIFIIKNEKYDLVILSHVLEHIEKRKEFLKQISELSSKIHIEVPDLASDALNFIRLNLELPVHKDDDHVVEFTIETLECLLVDSGLIIESLKSRDGCLVAVCRS